MLGIHAVFVDTSKVQFRFSFHTSRPSAKQWSWFFSSSRPSARQWSSISLHQDPLRGNGHWFLMSHRGPLWGNGHRSFYIKTLCEAMVIVSFTSRPSARQWSSMSLHQDPLRDNGHWFLYQIGTLYVVMVTKSLDIDPLIGIGLISFSKIQSYKKIFF